MAAALIDSSAVNPSSSCLFPIGTLADLDCYLTGHVESCNDPKDPYGYAKDAKTAFYDMMSVTDPKIWHLAGMIMFSLLNYPGNEVAAAAHIGWGSFDIPSNFMELLENPELKDTSMRLLCILASTFPSRADRFFASARTLRLALYKRRRLRNFVSELLLEAIRWHPKSERQLRAFRAATGMSHPVCKTLSRFPENHHNFAGRVRARLALMRGHRGQLPIDFSDFLCIVHEQTSDPHVIIEEFRPFADDAVDDVVRVACHLPPRSQDDNPRPKKRARGL